MIKSLPVDWSGGVNLFADPTQIRDNQIRLAKNLVPAEGGRILSSRGAMKVATELIPSSPFQFIPLRAQKSSLGGVDLVYYDSASDTIRFTSTGSAPVNVGLAGTRNLPISLVNFFGIPYCFTGFNSGFRVVQGVSGPEAQALVYQGVGNAAFRPKGAAPVRARMCYWAGREIAFSDSGDATKIRDNTALGLGTIEVAGDTLDEITHVQELNTTASGSPTQSVVAVWTTDAMYMLLGEPGETGDIDSRGTLQVTKLTVAAGCVSGATVVQTPYGTIWAGADDVWMLPFGSLPIRIGTNIRPALLNTPPALRYRWHAAYENGIYRLALDSPGAGPGEISGCSHHWLLDMRQGPPQDANSAVWWGPQEYNPSGSSVAGPGTWAFITLAGDNGTGEVQSVQPWYAQDSVSEGYGVTLCTLNASDSRDEAAPNYPPNPPLGVTQYELGDIVVPYDESFGLTQYSVWECTAAGTTAADPQPQFNDGTSTAVVSGSAEFQVRGGFLYPQFIPTRYQSGNEIVPEFLGKEYLGDSTRDKLYDGTECGYWVNRAGYVEHSALTDIDTNKHALLPSGSDTAQSRLPFAAQRIWQSKLLSPQVGRRFHAKSLQFSWKHKTSFVVNATNDTVLLRDNGVNNTKVTIPRGEYPELADLTNQISIEIASQAGFVLQFSSVNSLISAVSVPASVWAIFFDRTASGTIAGWTDEDYRRCARLFAMLGVDTNNQNWYSTSPTFVWQSLSGARVYGKASPEQTRTFRSAISALNMRVDTFARGPT